MKKTILIILVICVFVLFFGSMYLITNFNSRDVAGNKYDDYYTPEKEKACCEDCVLFNTVRLKSYSLDCSEVLEGHNVDEECKQIMKKYPHTANECSKLFN